MTGKGLLGNIVISLCKGLFSVPLNESRDIGNPKQIIIIRQHNQLGDLLAGVSLFRAIKETYPNSHITLVVSPTNLPGMVKNKYIDNIFIFDKRKFFNPAYFRKTWHLLRKEYDLAIVPVVVSISFTSNLLARLSNSKVRIGANSLDGNPNPSAFLFDRRVDLDWRMHPDSNVSEHSLDIVRPFGINTKNYRSEISFNGSDTEYAENFLNGFSDYKNKLLVGLHVGAGKPNNRWSLDKFASLMKKISGEYPTNFYITGGSSEQEEINHLAKNSGIQFKSFINKPIPKVAALISKSDLFISNDTGIMHVAGTTDTPQISIFGPTNPFNWAPLGPNKYFIRKSDLIDDVSVDDVFQICKTILNSRESK